MRRKLKKNSAGSLSVRIRRFLCVAAAAVIITGCASQEQPVSPADQAGAEAVSEESSAQGQTSGAAAADTDTAGAGKTSELAQSDQADGAAKAEEGIKEGVKEEKDLVTVVIPTVYEDVTSQEEADQIRDRNGYESAVLEEDGSLTIVMSRSQYDEMISQFKESVDKGISEIISGGTEIEKIEYNDDYSVFTVTVSGDEIGIIERQTADELVMYGALYHIYTGNDADHIQVDYVSRESGEVIESADSGSLGNAY